MSWYPAWQRHLPSNWTWPSPKQEVGGGITGALEGGKDGAVVGSAVGAFGRGAGWQKSVSNDPMGTKPALHWQLDEKPGDVEFAGQGAHVLIGSLSQM